MPPRVVSASCLTLKTTLGTVNNKKCVFSVQYPSIYVVYDYDSEIPNTRRRVRRLSTKPYIKSSSSTKEDCSADPSFLLDAPLEVNPGEFSDI
jgi:hypothetical protein